MKYNEKSIFQNFISQTFELRTVEQRHSYFHTSRNASYFRPRTNYRDPLSKPNQEPPFCDMQSINQLPMY